MLHRVTTLLLDALAVSQIRWSAKFRWDLAPSGLPAVSATQDSTPSGMMVSVVHGLGTSSAAGTLLCGTRQTWKQSNEATRLDAGRRETPSRQHISP